MFLTYPSFEVAEQDIIKHVGNNILKRNASVLKFYFDNCTCGSYTYFPLSHYENRTTEQDALLMFCRTCNEIKVLYEKHNIINDFIIYQANYKTCWKKYYNMKSTT